MPASIVERVKMSSARIYLQVQNPLIWSPVQYYKDNKAIDPDALSYSTRFSGSTANNGGVSFDNLPGTQYPATRAFIVGVNVGF